MGADAAAPRPVTSANAYLALGCAVWLMRHHPPHRNWPVREVLRLLAPPIECRQFRLYEVGGRPVGFVSWAFLSTEAAQGFSDGTRRLRRADWTGGDAPWIIDMVAPFGHTRAIVRDLRCAVFPRQRVMSLRRRADGSIRKVNHWWGAELAGRNDDPPCRAAIFAGDP